MSFNEQEAKNKDMLIKGAFELDVIVDAEKADKMLKLKDMVLKWNKAFRLTEITEDREFIINTCLTLLVLFPCRLGRE